LVGRYVKQRKQVAAYIKEIDEVHERRDQYKVCTFALVERVD
jgi:hypothetical protein